MKTCSKSRNRVLLIDSILNVMTDKEIYEIIDYKKKNEYAIKQFMYQPLLNKLIEKFKDVGYNDKRAIKKAKECLIWESNKQTILHNMVFFGTQHRPDMEINVDGISIAVEVKKGNNGSDIRQGIGQCIVYSSKYDFIAFLFIDTSCDKRIYNSVNSEKEQSIIQGLWNDYNIMFKIV